MWMNCKKKCTKLSSVVILEIDMSSHRWSFLVWLQNGPFDSILFIYLCYYFIIHSRKAKLLISIFFFYFVSTFQIINFLLVLLKYTKVKACWVNIRVSHPLMTDIFCYKCSVNNSLTTLIILKRWVSNVSFHFILSRIEIVIR